MPQLVQLRQLSHQLVVVFLFFSQEGGDTWIIQGIDNFHLAVLTMSFAQRCRNGIRNAAMPMPIIGGQNENMFHVVACPGLTASGSSSQLRPAS